MRRSSSSLFAATGTLLVLVACTGGVGHVASSGGASTGTVVSADVGLVSAVAGDGVVRLDWKATDLAGAPVAVALFQSTQLGAVYSGAPIATTTGSSTWNAFGLVDGTKYFFGLALDRGIGTFEPIGAVLSARPNPPIYVRAGASSSNADGLTPSTAFPDPISAILTAQIHGAGNVWLAAGDYFDLGLPLYSRVDLYGGFAADFDLATRDPAALPTRLHGRSPLNVLTLIDGNTGSVVDGLELVGDQKGVIGFESRDTPCQLRAVKVSGMKGRGLKVSTTVEDRVIAASFVACTVDANGADGLFVQGGVDVEIEHSSFTHNVQEGVECGPLVAPSGVRLAFDVRGSQFVDNGFEGLKLNLAPPTIPAVGAVFDVAIEGSTFERNRQKAGLLIDVDFNLIPGWRLELLVRGCLARNNQNDGVQLQLDSTSTALIHDLRSSANGGDGLQVSSQSTPSHAVVAASVLVGNRGFGLFAEGGNVPVLASHLLIAGNALGGFASTSVESSAVSTIAALQPNPFLGVRTHDCVIEADPNAPLFVRSPREYRGVDGFVAPKLVLDDLGSLTPGERVELADDGAPRTLSAVGPGTQVALAPVPDFVLLPTTLFVFAGAGGVDEDEHVVQGSVAFGAAMTPLGAPPVDAGPLGAPNVVAIARLEAGAAPLFFLARTTPRLDQALGAFDVIELEFAGGALDPSSVDAQSVRVLDAQALELGATLLTVGNELQLAPPPAGWPSGPLLIELHATLRTLAGEPNAAPLALAYTVG
ncbi:MAG: right-handed parallel beta-helix repeat-containing protein [Planctomycetes bacterium]|nr:right-handed parallel beta-helix repeat-containing protein [Planctomycetota bacterium]